MAALVPNSSMASAALTKWGVRCRGIWASAGAQGPVVKLIFTIQVSAMYTLAAFAATAVHFSDPKRDPSFRSKRNVAAVLLLAAVAGMGGFCFDLWAYFPSWSSKGLTVIIQARPFPPCSCSVVCLEHTVPCRAAGLSMSAEPRRYRWPCGTQENHMCRLH